MITASVIALFVLALLSIFQCMLIAGAPLGHFAWGGQQRTLTRKLRIGSAISLVIYALFAAFIASKADFSSFITNSTILNAGLWIMTAYLVLGVFMNAISRSKHERYTMTPIAIVLAVCLYVVASA